MSLKLINIYPSDTEHIRNMISLSDREFGNGFYTEGLCVNQLLQSEGNACICYLDGTCVGFGIAYPSGSWYPDIKKIHTHSVNSSYIQTLLVDTNLRRLGIGTRIFRWLCAEAQERKDVNVVFHIWNESPGNSSRLFFEKNGAKEIVTHENFWKESSIQEGWKCIRCGNPCTCSSSEMLISLTD